MASGHDKVASGRDEVESGRDEVESACDEVASDGSGSDKRSLKDDIRIVGLSLAVSDTSHNVRALLMYIKSCG